MSHFTVLVVANNRKDLNRKLLPFHEYECTGIVEHTVLVEMDEDYLNDYHKDDGSLDVEELLAHGKVLQDGKWYRRTNPNSKWDWWTIGGRWTGKLKLKVSMDEAPWFTGDGEPWLITTDPNNNQAQADYAPAGIVDWEGMFEHEDDQEFKRYRVYQAALNSPELAGLKDSMLPNAMERWGESGKAFSGTWAKSPEDVAEAWAIDQLACKALREEHIFGLFEFDEHPKYRVAREAFIKSLDTPAITYAFVGPDGKWNQRAQMGWWGCSDKNMATDDYNKSFWAMVRSLPDEQMVWVVDCHI